MPTDDINNNDLPLVDSEGDSSSGTAESGGDSESGDLPIVEPEDPPAPPQVDDFVLCEDVPDRTAYAVHSDNPWKCHLMQFGLLWADINTPGFEADLLVQANAKRALWGVPEWAEMVAAYTFSDLTPDP